MVSDRELLMVGAGQDGTAQKSADPDEDERPRVTDIMSQPVLTLSPDDAVRSATWLMITQRVHAIPLIRGDRLVGLVTESDMLHGLISSGAVSQLENHAVLQQPVMSHIRGKLVTVGPTASLDDVVDIMRSKQIRHLPVVDGDELVGIVSDRDVRRALGNAAAKDAQAQESGKLYLEPSEVCRVMTKVLRTISPSASVEAAAEELLRHKVHCLLVVDDGKLLGVITDTDLLKAIGAADKEDSLKQ
jgi:CBS domain-containing protein